MGGGVVEVIATSGDPRVGGNDWDLALVDWLEQQCRSMDRQGPGQGPRAGAGPRAGPRAGAGPRTGPQVGVGPRALPGQGPGSAPGICSRRRVCPSRYRAQHGVPLRGLAYRRVLDAAVEAKHALSRSATTTIEV